MIINIRPFIIYLTIYLQGESNLHGVTICFHRFIRNYHGIVFQALSIEDPDTEAPQKKKRTKMREQ